MSEVHEIILTISTSSSLSMFKRLGIIERMQRVHVGGRKSVHRRRKGFPKKTSIGEPSVVEKMLD